MWIYSISLRRKFCYFPVNLVSALALLNFERTTSSHVLLFPPLALQHSLLPSILWDEIIAFLSVFSFFSLIVIGSTFFSDFLSVWGFMSYHNEAFVIHFQIFLVLTHFRNWIWEPTNQSNAFKNDLMIYSPFNKVTLAFLCWNM